MPRYTKTQVTQLSANEQAAIDNINKNFDDIQSAIQDTVSRSGNTPTHMTHDLDMNGKRIINVPAPRSDTDLVRRQDVVDDIALVQNLVNATTNAAAQTLQAAAEVQEIMQDENVGLVADDLALGDNSKIKQVAENKNNIDTVASLEDDIEIVVGLKDDIPVVVQAAEDIDKVEDIAEDITAVANNASNITAVAENKENINAVNANKTNIDVVADNEENINAVAGNKNNIDTVAGISSDVSTIASNSSDVSNVATNMSDINSCAGNISAIQQAPTAASSAAQSAQTAVQAALSITNGYDLLDHKWSDHLLNDQNWLRADTFSWQDGTVYSDAYDHLVADYNGGTPVTETIGSYTITYKFASDGHMITTDETNVANIYVESGVAWYYVLDTTNQRFKLPRINPAKEGLLQTAPTTTSSTANNYAPVSLYWNVAGSSTRAYGDSNSVGNGKRMIGIDENGYTHQVAAYVASNTFAGNVVAPRNLVTNLSSATSIYKGNMYLYFYVGQFSQTATEQTAGLNTELFNGKADRDLNNLTSQAGAGLNSVGVRTVVETYKNGTSWYRIWSDGWIEQGGSYDTTGTYNFLKPFTDTNYCWTSGGFNNSAENVAYQRDAALDRTTTSFRVVVGQKSTWYACGY